jgi:RNA polymerase sigma factor (sigma-70 family)
MPIEHDDGSIDDGATIAADRALVALCVSGSRQAWATFVAAHTERIRHAIRQSMARHRSRLTDDEIEDLHAEVLTSLVTDDYRRLRTYEGRNGCRLGTWVGLVAARIAINHLAQLRRWELVRPGTLDPTPLVNDRPDDGPDAEDILAHQQAVEGVESALLQLTPADQLFVKLCFYQEWSSEEIARFLGVSRGTVYSRKHRILQRLRALLIRPDTERPESTGANDPHGMGETP